jgi:hypothetical protein
MGAAGGRSAAAHGALTRRADPVATTRRLRERPPPVLGTVSVHPFSREKEEPMDLGKPQKRLRLQRTQETAIELPLEAAPQTEEADAQVEATEAADA